MDAQKHFEQKMATLGQDVGLDVADSTLLIFTRVVDWQRGWGHGTVTLRAVDHMFDPQIDIDGVVEVDRVFALDGRTDTVGAAENGPGPRACHRTAQDRFEQAMTALRQEVSPRAATKTFRLLARVVDWLRCHGHGTVTLSAVQQEFGQHFRIREELGPLESTRGT